MKHDPEKFPDFQNLRSQQELIEKREWDCLIVLDACRWDALNQVLDRHVPKVRTPGYCTPNWCNEVWDQGGFEDVTYISANPFTEHAKNMDEYGVDMDERVDHIKMWEEYADRHCWQVLPESLTEESKKHSDPMVLHFMQPHTPFIGNIKLTAKRTADLPDCIPEIEKTSAVYAMVRKGLVKPELVRAAYLENLKFVLRELQQLSNNHETFVVTADHGECLGPKKWDHGRPTDPRNRIVPWIQTGDITSCLPD